MFRTFPFRQEQLHELLARDARNKWADVSKVRNICIDRRAQGDSAPYVK